MGLPKRLTEMQTLIHGHSPENNAGSGGKGIVIIRYKYQ